MARIEDAVLVVAHPDDEVLWFSSILRRCKAVIVCFGASATSRLWWDKGRAALIKDYPLAKARFLRVQESDAFGTADWEHPVGFGTGLRLRRPSSSYEKNGEELLSLLRPILQGERLVFTHNPWGEYGHEEHVQVSNLVATLMDELGFELFVSSYVSNRTCNLMLSRSHLLGDPDLVLKTDTQLAAEFKKLYIDYNCWTWWRDYEWPSSEAFYRVANPVEAASEHRMLTATRPANFINFNFKPNLLRRSLAKVLTPSAKTYLKRALKID